MIKKPITLLFVLLMVSSIVMTPQTTNSSTLDFTLEKRSQVAATDLDRITLNANVFPNDGLEEWSNTHQPSDFSTSRSEEVDLWLEPTIVFEGSHSMGIEARAMDTYHAVDVTFHRTSQYHYLNIANMTLDLEWYLDSIGTPVELDYVRMEVRLDYRNLYYYLGCETSYTNYTNNAYFEIAGPLQTWNHLHRNLTSDYLERFGELPAELTTLEWHIRTYTPLEYTRVFLDDLHVLNGTIPIFGGSINHADFEETTGWYIQYGFGAGDIAQCSDSHSGYYSMNLTALTFDDNAHASAYRQPKKLLSSDNQANLSFWWKLDDYVNPSNNVYARVQVNLENATFQASFYYYMFVGGSGGLPIILFGNNMKYAVNNFNVTDTWNFFERNIWEDFTSVYTTENLWVDSIEFEVINNADNARVSLLIDDISFAPSILNDMDYEHQNAVGEPIQGWEYPPGPDELTVTDFAENGNKAAKLTLVEDYTYLNQDLHKFVCDSTTELILDFDVYIDTFNQSSEDYIFFQLYFDEVAFSYVIANSSSAFEDELEGEGDANFILLQDTIVTGEWLNFKLDIVHDYELLTGSLPDTIIYSISLLAEAGDGSQLEVYFDDLYIYYDSAPSITGVEHFPEHPINTGNTTVSAMVVDATLETVVLNYRVDNGTWMVVPMNPVDSVQYEFNITALPAGTYVEYYITATDAFGKSTDAMDGVDYFSFTVGTPVVPPSPILPIVVVVIIAAVGVVILLYMFVLKKKE